jgi:hypothetical protein
MNKLQNFMDQLKLGQALPTSNSVLDPNITADELANQSDNPLFVAPNEFAATELADVQTQKPAPAYPTNQMMQDEANDIANQKEQDIQDLSGPTQRGVVESGQVSQTDFDIARGNAAPQTEYEKLQAKLQELRDLEAAQGDTAAKYNFGAKAAGIIGDTLARYNTAAIQKNVKAPIQYSGPKLQEMMSIIGEVKAPGTMEQRKALLDQYRQEQINQISANKLAEAKLKEAGRDARLSNREKERELDRDLKKQQYSQLGDSQVEKLATLKESLDESNALLPQLEKTRKSLGIINTPVSEIEVKFGKNPEYQKLKQNYSSLRNSVRKAIFGATLTPGEEKEFENELSGISISDKNLEGSINNLIGRVKSRARARLNTIAETQPLKADTARNAIKSFGLDEVSNAKKHPPVGSTISSGSRSFRVINDNGDLEEIKK